MYTLLHNLMRRYTLQPHVADIRLYLEATTPEELFTVSVEGLAYVLAGNSCQFLHRENTYTLSHPIHLSSVDQTSLLIDFLSSVLSTSMINRSIYCQTKIVDLKENHLDAILYGYNYESIKQEIKAVSYTEAKITKNDINNLETTIVLEI